MMGLIRNAGLKDAIGSLAAVAYSIPSWAYPFGGDQGLHWYVGRYWLEGEVPFVSAISNKPIGWFAVHAAATFLMGLGRWPIRVVDSITVVVVGWLIALAVRSPGTYPRDGERGAAALLFSGAYYTYFDYWDTAHPELWEGMLLVAAFLVAARADSRWSRDAGAGALVAAAFMFKFPAALPGLGVAALCALRALRERGTGDAAITAVLGAAARFLTGAAPVFALSILPFAISGQLAPMKEILFDYTFRYVELARPVRGTPAWMRLEYGGPLLLATGAAALLSGVAMGFQRQRREAAHFAWLVALAILCAGAVAIQKRYFGYHFVVMVPFCVALLLFCAQAIAGRERASSWGGLLATCAVVILMFHSEPAWGGGRTGTYKKHLYYLVDYLRGAIARERYLGLMSGKRPLDGPLLQERVARLVNAKKRPGDTLCARGFPTPLYQLTGLRCPSRHLNQMIVDNGLPGWRREYRETLERHPPTFLISFIDRTRDTTYIRSRGYHLIGTVGRFAVFSLRT